MFSFLLWVHFYHFRPLTSPPSVQPLPTQEPPTSEGVEEVKEGEEAPPEMEVDEVPPPTEASEGDQLQSEDEPRE